MKLGRSVMSTRVKIKLDSFGTKGQGRYCPFQQILDIYRSAKDAIRLISHDSIEMRKDSTVNFDCHVLPPPYQSAVKLDITIHDSTTTMKDNGTEYNSGSLAIWEQTPPINNILYSVVSLVPLTFTILEPNTYDSLLLALKRQLVSLNFKVQPTLPNYLSNVWARLQQFKFS